MLARVVVLPVPTHARVAAGETSSSLRHVLPPRFSTTRERQIVIELCQLV